MSEPQAFKDSAEAKFRREVRSMIRRGPFSKADRDVTLALVNHWLHHRRTSEVIHPGRTKLAAKAGVSVSTVKRCLALLRHYGAIDAVAHEREVRRRIRRKRANV